MKSFLLPLFLLLTFSVARSQNSNTVLGWAASFNQPSGGFNNAEGFFSMYENLTGVANVGIGYASLANNKAGNQNVGIGADALYWNVSSDNTGCGYGAMRGAGILGYGSKNSALGTTALYNMGAGCSNNIGIGWKAGFTLSSGSDNIYVGNLGVASESGIIRLGTPGTHTATFLSGNIGVGTVSAPQAALQIEGTQSISAGARIVSVGTLTGIHLEIDNDEIQAGSASPASGNPGLLSLNSNGGNVSVCNLGGNVGIGTNLPTKAKLEIQGTVTNLPVSGPYGLLGVNGAESFPAANSDFVSIFASGVVWSGDQFIASSDERIKNILGQSNGATDLRNLLRIEITDFLYKDVAVKGDRPQKKVIAQQVEEVFPQAVSKHTDVVPDIYQKAGFKDGWVSLPTNLKKGERVRLVSGKKDAVHEVLEVAADRFRTDFIPEGASVFVYGREVKDFLAVDYEAISMLNVSATQELARRLEIKDAQIARLMAENAAMKEQLAAQAAADKSLEARLARLEQAAHGSAQAVKVALTK